MEAAKAVEREGMKREIRAVVIGFGGMGGKYAQILAEGRIDGMMLRGICCRNAAGQERIRRLYPQAAIYHDVEDTFAHQEDFDAVVIVTPHATHVEIARKAFAHGKHVICDKPAGIHTKEVGQLLAVKPDQVKFAMMFNTRALPAFQKAKELLDAGTLGSITRAVWICNNWFRSPAYHHSAPWRSSWCGEHGGLLINQCQHYLDIWQWLLGMPDTVDADIDFGKYNDFLVDDSVDLRLCCAGSPAFRGSFLSASGEHPGVNRLEIWGTRGQLAIHDGTTLTMDRNLVDIDTFNQENTEIYGMPRHQKEAVPLPEARNSYEVMFQNFSDHIRTGAALTAPGEQGLNSLLLANAAYLSAWTGEKVALPLDEDRYIQLLEQAVEREQGRKPGGTDRKSVV